MQTELNHEFSLIKQAAKRCASMLTCTNVVQSEALNVHFGATLYLKSEHTQVSGSFKFRGACNALLQLSEAERQRGVFTVSSGNHGAALAAAGQKLGIAVRVGAATNASAMKLANMRRYGAEIIPIEPGMPAREAFAEEQKHTGRRFIPPYDHPHIIHGQGTAALELLLAHPEINVLVTPLGGGGLLSGTSIVGAALGVERIYGIEPELAADGKASITTGVLQPAMPPRSVCDGLLTSLGEHTFLRIQHFASDVLLVSDNEALDAQRQCYEITQQWIEPSSATVLAAIKRYPQHFAGRRIGLIISGGNCAPAAEY